MLTVLLKLPTDHSYRIRPLEEQDARDILSWRYPSPYDFYNPPQDDHAEHYISQFMEPALAFHAIIDEQAKFVGFCSFGSDGQVPGGDYSEDALDIGLGMRPELTGQGRGEAFFDAILKHGLATFKPQRVRLTVASFNQRAMALYQKFGFTYHDEFVDSVLAVSYVVLVRESA